MLDVPEASELDPDYSIEGAGDSLCVRISGMWGICFAREE